MVHEWRAEIRIEAAPAQTEATSPTDEVPVYVERDLSAAAESKTPAILQRCASRGGNPLPWLVLILRQTGAIQGRHSKPASAIACEEKRSRVCLPGG